MKTKLIKFRLYIDNKKKLIIIIIKKNNKNMQKTYIFKFHNNFFNIKYVYFNQKSSNI